MMREKLIERILNMFNNEHYDEGYPACGTLQDIQLYSDLLEEIVTFQDYLEGLTDEGLIGVFESQCRQKYR